MGKFSFWRKISSDFALFVLDCFELLMNFFTYMSIDSFLLLLCLLISFNVSLVRDDRREL